MSTPTIKQAPGGLLSLRRSPSAAPLTREHEGPDAIDGGPTPYRLHRRFDRMGRLVGDQGMRRLLNSHVMLFGVGGVGSWAAEALVRAGVGHVSLVDFDLVCVTNANRQLHALKGATGKPKVEVMAQRLRLIHPNARIDAIASFYEAQSSEALLGASADAAPDLVIDAIDNIKAKAHLIASCRERAIPVVVSGGASGRMDPTAITETDLSLVKGDPFLAAVRKTLRQHHNFPRETPWDIRCVHSNEPVADPVALEYDEGQGFRCVCPQGDNGKHTCDARNLIYGTAGFVTGAFGLACSAAAVRMLLASRPAT